MKFGDVVLKHPVLVFAVLFGTSCIRSCIKDYLKHMPTEHADSLIEVSETPSPPYIQHNTSDGLHLTITENQDRKRQISFFDYGFDGKLDHVRINQVKSREYLTTNLVELTGWQPIFERYRAKRFGNYTNSFEWRREFERR